MAWYSDVASFLRQLLQTSIPQCSAFTARIGTAHPTVLAAHDNLRATGHFNQRNLVPTGLQLLHKGRAEAACLKFGVDIAAAEIGQADGVLRVQFPVQQANHRLVDVLDDLRTTRRTNGCDQFATVAVEHQGRGH